MNRRARGPNGTVPRLGFFHRRETSGFVRVCFAADEELLRRAIVRMRRFVETLVR